MSTASIALASVLNERLPRISRHSDRQSKSRGFPKIGFPRETAQTTDKPICGSDVTSALHGKLGSKFR